MHPLFGFLDRRIGQPDQPQPVFAELARIDFDFDRDGFDADQGGRSDDGEHVAGQGETRVATIPDAWGLNLSKSAHCWVFYLGNPWRHRLS